MVPSTCKLPSICTVPVLSPTTAGSIIKLAGPLREFTVTSAAFKLVTVTLALLSNEITPVVEL